jgi:hypothetical protein
VRGVFDKAATPEEAMHGVFEVLDEFDEVLLDRLDGEEGVRDRYLELLDTEPEQVAALFEALK